MDDLVAKAAIIDALKSTIPNAEWLLKRIESEQGWLRFPSCLTEAISVCRLESYPLLYANEAAIGGALIKGLLPEDQVLRFNAELENASIGEQAELMAGLSRGLIDGLDQMPQSPKAQEEARFHDLRHTWASWHRQSGTSCDELKELGGWKSRSMVDRYAKFATEHLAAAATRIASRRTGNVVQLSRFCHAEKQTAQG